MATSVLEEVGVWLHGRTDCVIARALFNRRAFISVSFCGTNAMNKTGCYSVVCTLESSTGLLLESQVQNKSANLRFH